MGQTWCVGLFPKASPKGDYLQVVDAAHSNVLFRLPAGRTLLCPSGVLRIVARGIHELVGGQARQG